MTLATTGCIYLFDDEINGLVYGDRLFVQARASERLHPSAQLDAALQTLSDARANEYVAPAAPDRSSVFGLTTSDGESVMAYLDPYTGRFLGAVIGALGVSGGTVPQDVEVAQAAFAAFASLTR